MANSTLDAVTTLVRQRLSDNDKTGFSDSELKSYVADSLRLLVTGLISNYDPVLRRTATLAQGDSLPSGFVAWAGRYPIEMTGSGTVNYIDGSTSMAVNYWYNPPIPAGINDEMPLPDIYLSAIVYGATIYAFNRNEADVTQDAKILQEMMNLIAQAKKQGV